MSTNLTTQKEWKPTMRLDEVLSCSIAWLTRARNKNVVAQHPPVLYMAYVLDDVPFLGFMHDYTRIFKYSNKDTPDTDRARDAALRLLAVATKAHYFIGKEALCKHEPYLFTLPDLARPSAPHYGIVYKIETRPAKTIICATCDIGLASSLKPDPVRFPVVLTSNSYKWFDKKHWQELSKEAETLDKVMHPWIQKREFEIAEKWTTLSDFPFGTLLDVSYDIKDYIKPTGAKWCDGLKKWYIPKGFDVAPILEYIRWIDAQFKKNRDELDALHWQGMGLKARRHPLKTETDN